MICFQKWVKFFLFFKIPPQIKAKKIKFYPRASSFSPSHKYLFITCILISHSSFKNKHANNNINKLIMKRMVSAEHTRFSLEPLWQSNYEISSIFICWLAAVLYYNYDCMIYSTLSEWMNETNMRENEWSLWWWLKLLNFSSSLWKEFFFYHKKMHVRAEGRKRKKS